MLPSVKPAKPQNSAAAMNEGDRIALVLLGKARYPNRWPSISAEHGILSWSRLMATHMEPVFNGWWMSVSVFVSPVQNITDDPDPSQLFTNKYES